MQHANRRNLGHGTRFRPSGDVLPSALSPPACGSAAAGHSGGVRPRGGRDRGDLRGTVEADKASGHLSNTSSQGAQLPVPPASSTASIILVDDSSSSTGTSPASTVSPPVPGAPSTPGGSSSEHSSDNVAPTPPVPAAPPKTGGSSRVWGSSSEDEAPVQVSRKRKRGRRPGANKPPRRSHRAAAAADKSVRERGGAGCVVEAVAAGDSDKESTDAEERLQQRGVDCSVVGGSSDDDGSSIDTPKNVDTSLGAARSWRKPRKYTKYSENAGEYGAGDLAIAVRTRTSVLKSIRDPNARRSFRAGALWVSLDGRADRSGRRAFPPRATRSERRKWRKVMRKLQTAMPSILQEAARAAAEGALHPQTQATDGAARRARSEQCDAKFVYVYVCVNGDCKVCTNMVYVGERCCQDASATSESAFDNRDGEHIRASGKGVPKFDIHYQRHPMCFWRTMVYFYTGPDGDIPTRMAVAAVEHAIWKLFDAEGMAGLSSAKPTTSVLPLVPLVGDSDEWREMRTGLLAYKEERGDLRVPDGGTLGLRMRQVRLQRGLGDTAEEQWLTIQGFEWEADGASRAERNLCARQWPLVKTMIAWLEDNDGEWPRSFNVTASVKRGTDGVVRAARAKENILRQRWVRTVNKYGGVSLDHAKRIHAAALRGRRRGMTFRTGHPQPAGRG